MNKYHILSVVLMAAASAKAVESGKMSYDSLRAGYSVSKEIRGFNVGGSALLGDYVIIGGSYQKLTARNLDDVDGEASTFNLGVRYPVGPGDLLVGLSYGQLQGSGTHASAAVAVAANVTTVGLAYRYPINETFEVAAGYDRVRTEFAAGAVDLNTGNVYAGAARTNDNLFSLALRCNITKQFDVTASAGVMDGEGIWSISAGYNF